jgi:hypothetical protein
VPDMLVKLYNLPALQPAITRALSEGISLRRADAKDKSTICGWIKAQFNEQWSVESSVSFDTTPPCCFIAERNNMLVGFACYNATAKNFFGPTGVDTKERHKGIGAALLLCCLYALRDEDYAYAIIGGAGSTGFYFKTVGATTIEESEPGIYTESWFEKLKTRSSN